MIPSREAHDILGGHLGCLLDLGGVPRSGVYDNEAALVSRHNGRANLTEAFQRFRGTLGMGVIVCKPGDPEAKGLVERANGYLETSFMPGRSLETDRTRHWECQPGLAPACSSDLAPPGVVRGRPRERAAVLPVGAPRSMRPGGRVRGVRLVQVLLRRVRVRVVRSR